MARAAQGIKLVQDERRQANGLSPEGMDPRTLGQPDPTVTWITGNIVISNNVFGNQGSFGKGLYQVFGLDNRTNRAMDDWNVTVDGNLFNPKVNINSPSMVGWGKGDNVGLQLYETPASLAGAKNPAWVNAQVAGSERVEDMGPDKTTYASVAKPLPDDVAAAIGQPAGTQRLGAMTVNPVPANPPTAAFTSTSIGSSAAFDGSGSTDGNGTIISYAWDFGDGTFGSGATPTHVYQTSGTKTVKLTVTDNSGGTDTISQAVTLTPPPNDPPTASFTPTVTNESVAFDASGSTDSDGTISTYAWDFGDGATRLHDGGHDDPHLHDTGDHTVTLTVTDDDGAVSNTVTHVVTTNEPPPNNAPTAAFTSAVTNQSVAFDGSGSADPTAASRRTRGTSATAAATDTTTGAEAHPRLQPAPATTRSP